MAKSIYFDQMVYFLSILIFDYSFKYELHTLFGQFGQCVHNYIILAVLLNT